FKGLEKIDLAEIEKACEHDWFNQTLCQVNDSVVRLGILKGEFHWHKHDREDEFFYIVQGHLFLDFEDKTVELRPMQGIVVPRGVLHRPRVPERTIALMVENATITPTGDE
ncbi:cupin domain-containing protein, partial [bacterium]